MGRGSARSISLPSGVLSDNAQKGYTSNEFNRILDLANNSPKRNGQRSLFTKEGLLKLNSKWNKQKNWDQLDDDVQRSLKTSENITVKGLKKAYVKTLSYQTKCALTENEACFEVYACV
ncbi:hypothetical protein RMATCC62417_11510 [Rhizopus microsporus]|nr:hypothetical protein RMATCC62417_11510 [Rhizopus microsporus]